MVRNDRESKIKINFYKYGYPEEVLMMDKRMCRTASRGKAIFISPRLHLKIKTLCDRKKLRIGEFVQTILDDFFKMSSRQDRGEE